MVTAGWIYDDAGWLDPVQIGSGVHAWAYAPFAAALWLSGGLPWAAHTLILGLHLFNGVLLWLVMRPWLTPTIALGVLTLFWLHPLQVEAVAYVSGGIEVLLTTYVLLAWLTPWPLAVGLLWLGAHLKYSAMPILVLVPLAKVRRVPTWLPAMLVVVAAFVAQPAVIGYLHQGVPWAVRLQDAEFLSLAVWRYLAFLVWPVGFSIEHDWIAFAPFGPLALTAGLLVGVVAWMSRRAWRAPWWACVWIGGLLAPRLLAPHAPSLTEHHTYLTFLAVWLCAGSALMCLQRSPDDCVRQFESPTGDYQPEGPAALRLSGVPALAPQI